MFGVMDRERVTLTGTIVRLEPLTIAHVEPLADVGLEPDLWRLQPKALATVDDMRTYVLEALDQMHEGTGLPFVIVSQATGQIIGSTRFMDIQMRHRRLEIGATWLTSSHQRTLANTEAKLLLLKHAFDTLGVMRVVLKTDALNEQSRKAILRIGAVYEGTFRKHLIAESGRVRDMAYFSILESEWPEVEARLVRRLGMSG